MYVEATTMLPGRHVAPSSSCSTGKSPRSMTRTTLIQSQLSHFHFFYFISIKKMLSATFDSTSKSRSHICTVSSFAPRNPGVHTPRGSTRYAKKPRGRGGRVGRRKIKGMNGNDSRKGKKTLSAGITSSKLYHYNSIRTI